MTKYSVLLACLAATGAQAWECEFERQIDQSLDLSSAEQLSVIAGAGDLDITGRDGLDEATIKGTVCASEEEWLEQTSIDSNGGADALIAVVMPDVDWDSSWTGNRYLYIDLVIEVPADLPLDIKDSSGDVELSHLGAVSIQDSSGDIEIEDVAGNVAVGDSSGDVDLRNIGGDVTINHDSSGDLEGRDIDGSVLIVKDSSGDIEFHDVGQDFIVERDSSGDIDAHGVGGDFRVVRDGSGDIDSSDVAGEVSVPDKG